MNVKIIPIKNEDVIDKIYTAARTCYNEGIPEDMYDSAPYKAESEKLKLINQIIKSGHHSVLEHQQFTFLISGVDRNLTHQLVRHRQASYSQQSLRYCKLDKDSFSYTVPTSIKHNAKAFEKFTNVIDGLIDAYVEMTEMGIPAEDARYILPTATNSSIVVSFNIREFIHICNERLCTCAQAPIRELVSKMVSETVKYVPWLKDYLVPKCEMLGYCPEPKRRTCGRKPHKSEVFVKSNEK